MKKNLVVSTCGTSVLTNGAGNDMRKLLVRCANKKEMDIPSPEREAMDRWIEERSKELKIACDDPAARMSAEINGLLAFYRVEGTDVRDDGQDEHYLLVTDTYLGRRAFLCISGWIKRRFGRPPQMVSAGGLNTADISDFRAALADIVHQLDRQHRLLDWRNQGYHVVFNLTGGFKSVNGFMQTIGMLFANECFYLFEGSRELMRVPRLPIGLDTTGAFGANLAAVRRMANGAELTRIECGTLPETLLFEVSGSGVTLSEWGLSLWIAERREHYGKALMDPISVRLRFSDHFQRQGDGRTGILRQDDRLDQLNCRLDELARCMDGGGQSGGYNPRGLRFKKLASQVSGSTHEFHIWTDLDRRGYGHYDDDRFVVDRIDDHL